MFMFFSILSAYLIGSIPTAFILGKLVKGIDIRKHGSGNVGATNAMRVIGKGPGLAVFVIDSFKGFAAVTLLPFVVNDLFSGGDLYGNSTFYLVLAAAVVSGHIWTCFLGFKGGKGVATTAGAMLGLYPVIFFSGLIVWILVFHLWRYVSLASLAAAISLPILSVLIDQDLVTTVFMAGLCFLGVWSHRDNIKRLVQGTEKKIVKPQKR
jgi:acyl phosphate:glycerol-3-phosphate acyltransferase